MGCLGMKTETVSRVCGKCGAKIFADARRGVCTPCALGAGLDLVEDKDFEATDPTPMPPEKHSSRAAGLIPNEIPSIDHAKDIVRAYKREEPQRTLTEIKPELPFEIAHILLIDVVGYSKLLVNEQIELLQDLNRIVRNTNCFRAAESRGKLTRVPTGDGMALLCFHSPEEPAQCALEISRVLKEYPHIQLRMGVHSGPVNQVTDVNDRTNVAGAGINIAQRVMDCGDAGHILLSKHLADDLAEYRDWRPHLHDLGECEVKYGLRLHLFNFYKDNLGNPHLPEKLKRGRRWKQASTTTVRPISPPRWTKFVLIAALVVSAVVLTISFSIFFRREVGEATASIPEKSIAVLPF